MAKRDEFVFRVSWTDSEGLANSRFFAPSESVKCQAFVGKLQLQGLIPHVMRVHPKT